MENIRAYTIIRSLKGITEEVRYIPADICDNDNSAEIMRKFRSRVCNQEKKFWRQTSGWHLLPSKHYQC